MTQGHFVIIFVSVFLPVLPVPSANVSLSLYMPCKPNFKQLAI
jgi:hypothetical protein